jgi:hypothetical protein
VKSWTRIIFAGAIFLTLVASADTLGFIEQRFSYLNFEKGKWDRATNLPCYTYTARENDATVEVLRFGMSNLVSFKATKGLKVTVCGPIAAFDEGFEAGAPVPLPGKQKP